MAETVTVLPVEPVQQRGINGSCRSQPRRRPDLREQPEQVQELQLALDDAEALLRYATESGIAVDDQTVDVIVQARLSASQRWGGTEPGKLFAALTALSNATKPVTAASLRASGVSAAESLRSYRRMAGFLAAVIVPMSIVAFVCAGLSSAISKDIVEGNEIALTLNGYISVPGILTDDGASKLAPDARPKVQQLAALTRAIDSRAGWLNWFSFGLVQDEQMDLARNRASGAGRANFELTVADSNLADQIRRKVEFYQDVRYYAVRTQEAAQLVYGAVAACILPSLYALLGACASLVRAFADQTRARTYLASDANRARFLIAAIAGLVVGLFNSFTLQQGASLSPFAIAFLVGYASDAFFSFLDNTLTTITKQKI